MACDTEKEKGVPFDLVPYVDPPVVAGCATLQEAMSGPIPYVELDADGIPVPDPNSAVYASGQDLLLVNAVLAALRADSQVPSIPNEDPEQYAARQAANLWPCEFDEVSMSDYRGRLVLTYFRADVPPTERVHGT